MLSLLDCLNAAAVTANNDNMTREMFGKIMHDDSLTEKQKMDYLEKVVQEGGYDALP